MADAHLMSWAIERSGQWHSEGGWQADHTGAKRFPTPQHAHDARDELQATTPAALPGELHVRELSD